MLEAFVLLVSLSGDYKDERIEGYFANCEQAMYHYKQQCNDHLSARCLRVEDIDITNYNEYNIKQDTSFDFEIKERQSCGFVGVEVFTDEKYPRKNLSGSS